MSNEGSILPPRLLALMVASGFLALGMNWAAVPLAVHSGYPLAAAPEAPPVPDPTEAECAVANDHTALFEGQGRTEFCDRQLNYRKEEADEARRNLQTACIRYEVFKHDAAAKFPEARKWMRLETEEVEHQANAIRAAAGPAAYPEEWSFVIPFTLMVGLMTGVTWLASQHAASVGVRRLTSIREIARPLSIIAAVSLLVAVVVLALETIDPQKTDFDWCSYCVLPKAFWLAHASILPLSIHVAVPLAMGSYITRVDHVPWPDATKYRWGVQRYITFLELWGFAAIAITGGLTALWLKQLAVAASRTAQEEAWLGMGSVLITAWLVIRLVWNGHIIRERYESIMENHADRATLPPDPTASFLGERWWKVPTVLIAAFAIAHQALTWAGVERLIR